MRHLHDAQMERRTQISAPKILTLAQRQAPHQLLGTGLTELKPQQTPHFRGHFRGFRGCILTPEPILAFSFRGFQGYSLVIGPFWAFNFRGY